MHQYSIACVHWTTYSDGVCVGCLPSQKTSFTRFDAPPLTNLPYIRWSRFRTHLFGCDSVCGPYFGLKHTEGEKPFCDVANILMNIFRYVIADYIVLGFCDNSLALVISTSAPALQHKPNRHSKLFRSLKFRGRKTISATVLKLNFRIPRLLSDREQVFTSSKWIFSDFTCFDEHVTASFYHLLLFIRTLSFIFLLPFGNFLLLLQIHDFFSLVQFVIDGCSKEKCGSDLFCSYIEYMFCIF